MEVSVSRCGITPSKRQNSVSQRSGIRGGGDPARILGQGAVAGQGGSSPLPGVLLLITYSVFRLAARRTGSGAEAPLSESAPVSEKRVGLSRGPAPRLWAFNGPGLAESLCH
jgi:hypothetical protein